MSFFKKWYTYQKERFPILTFGIYVLSIVIAVFSYTNSKVTRTVDYMIILPMFLVTFLQFLMTRIVDEFKDYEEDCKYRPYRPVPRGLIKLKELKVLFIICVILQFFITIIFAKGWISIISLGIMWIFFAIMSKGFFIKKILDKHILLEVTLDEIMMPLMIAFLITFTPYINKNNPISINISNIFNVKTLLIMSYIVSWIVEVARKIRSKEQEEKGVKTYTAVLGITKATVLLTILETFLAIMQYLILGNKYTVIIVLLYIIIVITNILFVMKKSKKYAKGVELLANIYILIVYWSMLLLII